MPKLSEDIILQIPILYQELGTYKAVAEKLGISPSTVSRHIKNAQVTCAAPPNENEDKEKRVIDYNEVNDYFSFSLNYAETARYFGICTSTVKNHLTQENLDAAAAQNNDKSLLIDYIKKLFGEPISQWNFIQISKFKSRGINYKAQYLTLKYWFEVKQNSLEKAKGSIGIIPYQVDNARQYYMDMVRRRKLNEDKLKTQLSNEHITVTHTSGDYFVPPNRKKKIIDLNELSDIND